MSRSSSAHTSGAMLTAEIHRRIGSNVECELFDILAATPGCLQSFWPAVEPAFDACPVRSAAEELRQEADLLVRDALEFPNHLKWLRDQGYSREDSRQIRYVVEAFHSLEPVFAVLAGLALKWLAGDASGSVEPLHECDLRTTPAVFTGAIELADEPPGHPLFRALAVWPGYLAKVLEDCGPDTESLSGIVTSLPVSVDALARRIPIARPGSEVPSAELCMRIKGCLDRSLSAIVLASALRRSFVRAETAARNRRIRSAAA